MIRIRDSVRIPGKVRAVYWLIAINVLSYFVSSRGMPTGSLFMVGGLIPAELLYPEMLDPKLIAARPGPLVSLFWSMFLHGGFLHLFFNMLPLWILGPNVEARMGSVRFLLFYFSCGAVGMLCQVFYDLDSVIPIIGASGAISGIFGAYFALFIDHFIRITIGPNHNYRDIVIPIKVILIVWLLSQLFNALLPFVGQAQSIAFFTHLGGFICGLLLARGRSGSGFGKRKFRVFTGGRSEWPGFGGRND